MSSNNYFETGHLRKNIKSRSIRGLLVVFCSRGLILFIETIGIMVLARLLTPADYGLIAMVTVIVDFVFLFRNYGFDAATIWSEEINNQLISNIFWVNVIAGLAIGLVIAVLSPVIAWFYNEPRLVGITLAILPALIFSGAMLQHMALLKRQMKFEQLAIARVLANSLGLILAIICAFQGWGYWALIIQRIVTIVIFTICMWIFCHWIPCLPRKCHGTSSYLHFGGNVFAGQLFQYLIRHTDNVIIGRYIGSVSLGLYNKAYTLLMFPLRYINEPFTSVVVPALSRLQNEPERFRNYYRKVISIVAMISIPVVFFAGASAADIISIMLGPQWTASAKLFLYLIPAAFFISSNIFYEWVFLSLGQVSRQLRLQVVTGTGTLIAMFIGIKWGAEGVALAISAVNIIFWIPQMMYCYYYAPVSFKDLLSALFRPVIAASFSVLSALFMADMIGFSNPGMVQFVVKLSSFIATYFAVFLILPGGKGFMLDFIKYLFNINRKEVYEF